MTRRSLECFTNCRSWKLSHFCLNSRWLNNGNYPPYLLSLEKKLPPPTSLCLSDFFPTETFFPPAKIHKLATFYCVNWDISNIPCSALFFITRNDFQGSYDDGNWGIGVLIGGHEKSKMVEWWNLKFNYPSLSEAFSYVTLVFCDKIQHQQTFYYQ